MRAGVSVTDVTPPVGYRLHGHSLRKGSSTKVHDPLRVKVLTLHDGHRRVALISADLIGYPPPFVEALRRDLRRRVGMAPADLFLTCSHTHTGPCIDSRCRSLPPGHVLPHYIETVRAKIVGGVIEAIAREEPAALSWGRGAVDIGAVNRRKCTDQGVVTAPNPDGPVDPEVFVLRVVRPGGRTAALLFKYTCHPTTLDNAIAEISADYPGVAQRRIERAFPGAVALFLQGCCGDVRPALVVRGAFVGGTFADMERMGRRLAAAALQAAEAARPLRDIRLASRLIRHRFAFDPAALPVDVPSLNALARRTVRENPTWARWIRRWRDALRKSIARGEALAGDQPGDLHLLRIGEVVLVGLPGEAMVAIGLRLQQALDAPVCVTGYTDGDISYIPTREALMQGGYEALTFVFENHPAPFAPTMEDRLVQAVTRRVRALRGGPSALPPRRAPRAKPPR